MYIWLFGGALALDLSSDAVESGGEFEDVRAFCKLLGMSLLERTTTENSTARMVSVFTVFPASIHFFFRSARLDFSCELLSRVSSRSKSAGILSSVLFPIQPSWVMARVTWPWGRPE